MQTARSKSSLPLVRQNEKKSCAHLNIGRGGRKLDQFGVEPISLPRKVIWESPKYELRRLEAKSWRARFVFNSKSRLKWRHFQKSRRSRLQRFLSAIYQKEVHFNHAYYFDLSCLSVWTRRFDPLQGGQNWRFLSLWYSFCPVDSGGYERVVIKP